MVTAAGTGRDLWVELTGEGRPEYGRWATPSGLDVDSVLGRQGPTALDVTVRWVQARDHRGTRLTDMLWNTDMTGLKLISERMRDLLVQNGANLETFAVDVRLRNGDPVEGYVGVLEEDQEPGPVHSLWRGKRSHDFVVSDRVLDAIKTAGLTGLAIEPVDGPFPADQPGFSDD